MKTELTKEIEKKIFSKVGADGLGVYGCLEVALGNAYGSEYCDFMTMDSNNVFRCYEIKISKSDFRSKNKLSFHGDYNYFVMPEELYEEVKAEIPCGIGVWLYNSKGKYCYCEKKSNKKKITMGKKIDLMHCMVRSLSRYQTKLIKDDK